jgi:hypothetical protein
MLTGQTYDATRSDIEAYGSWLGHDGDWNTNGTSRLTIDRYLVERGFYLQTRYAAWFDDLTQPFAPIHYASVQQPSGQGHFVVVRRDGVVLDPMRAAGVLRLTDWPSINHVTGLRL